MAEKKTAEKKTADELRRYGYQDGQAHAGNITGQTTRQERDRRTQGAAYKQGYKQGNRDRRADLKSRGRQK